MQAKDKTFNLIISGVGGQGLVTLLNIVSMAAFLKGLDVKTSELHGLSQRGGSVLAHIRYGKKVFSPIVPEGQANLIIALEEQESLMAADFSSKETIFLINQFQSPTLTENFSKKQIENILQKEGRKYYFVGALAICQKDFNSPVLAGVWLLGYACSKGWIGLTKDDLLTGIEKALPPALQEMNKKAFLAGYKQNNNRL